VAVKIGAAIVAIAEMTGAGAVRSIRIDRAVRACRAVSGSAGSAARPGAWFRAGRPVRSTYWECRRWRGTGGTAAGIWRTQLPAVAAP